MKLQIGSRTRTEGWHTLDIQAGPEVDYVADCKSLTQIATGTVEQIYASHVLEHLSYKDEIPTALAEWFRVLKPGGILMVSVPDLAVLAELFADKRADAQDRARVMQVMFGAQRDAFDFHKAGLWGDLLGSLLHKAGFVRIERVAPFGLFSDDSTFTIRGIPISINVRALKPVS